MGALDGDELAEFQTHLSTGCSECRSRVKEASEDFAALLGALVLPGTIVEKPGWFRISLTASDAMVERGLEAFRAALATPVG